MVSSRLGDFDALDDDASPADSDISFFLIAGLRGVSSSADSLPFIFGVPDRCPDLGRLPCVIVLPGLAPPSELEPVRVTDADCDIAA